MLAVLLALMLEAQVEEIQFLVQVVELLLLPQVVVEVVRRPLIVKELLEVLEVEDLMTLVPQEQVTLHLLIQFRAGLVDEVLQVTLLLRLEAVVVPVELVLLPMVLVSFSV